MSARAHRWATKIAHLAYVQPEGELACVWEFKLVELMLLGGSGVLKKLEHAKKLTFAVILGVYNLSANQRNAR